MPEIQRRKTPTVHIGHVKVGSEIPVVVQSMTNTDTADIAGSIEQIAALAAAGSELVRVTVNNDDAAKAVPHIVDGLADRGIFVPIIGDFHYNGHQLLRKYPECASAPTLVCNRACCEVSIHEVGEIPVEISKDCILRGGSGLRKGSLWSVDQRITHGSGIQSALSPGVGPRGG